jgi:hypothetical protein
VHVGIDGIGEGRDEHARPLGAHLVLVDEDLRIPLVIDGAIEGAGLELGEHVPVAIVVVAGVVMVEPGQASAVVLGAGVFAVVVDDHLLAVGIERGDQQQHDVVEATLGLVIRGGGQRVRPLHGHLRGADLARVDVARDQDDGLAFAHEPLRLGVGEAARIGETFGDLLDPILVAKVLLRGDDGHDHLFAERGLAEDLHLHARRGGVEGPEIGADLLVVGEFSVRADVELQELRRRRNLRGEWKRGKEKEQDAFHGGGIIGTKGARHEQRSCFGVRWRGPPLYYRGRGFACPNHPHAWLERT